MTDAIDRSSALPDPRTPAQRRLVEDLLGWRTPRPPAPVGLDAELRHLLEDGIEPIAAEIPDGENVFVGKSSLDRLVCDGLFLDREESEFSWSLPMVLGKLAHKAIEDDWRSGATLAPGEVVDRSWRQFASTADGFAGFLNGLDAPTDATLRHDATQYLTEFRDTWPPMPDWMQPRLESKVRVTLAGGRVVLGGTPDLTMGRLRGDSCRMLLVDFKTGMRKPQSERDELRFYALLLTLKYGVPPFRWAAYYVAECAWSAEDFDPQLLYAAVRRVIDGVAQAVKMRYHRPADDALALRGGSWCRWCSRREYCPAAVGPDPDRPGSG